MACLDAKSISNCFSYFNGIHYFLVDMGFCATNMKFFFLGGGGWCWLLELLLLIVISWKVPWVKEGSWKLLIK